MSRARIAVLGMIVLAVGMAGYSFNSRPVGMFHDSPTDATNVLHPSETGQSAFAAIAEIVALLQSNPKTDWSKVNINKLRAHLVDMELLTTQAIVVETKKEAGMVFTISGSEETRKAIQAMVPAHAKELIKTTNWTVSAEVTSTGAELDVTTKTELERAKIQALGFFGIMATGAHHQAHHLAMATGQAHGH